MNRIELKKWMEAINLTLKLGWAGLTLMSALGFQKVTGTPYPLIPVWPFIWIGFYRVIDIMVSSND